MSWGEYGSATAHKRYMEAVQTRRICFCGCKQRASFIGMANGVALAGPMCELAARRWVKTGQFPRQALSVME